MPDRNRREEGLEHRPESLEDRPEFTSVVQELRRLDHDSLSRLEYGKDRWDHRDSRLLIQALEHAAQSATSEERDGIARDLAQYAGLEEKRNALRFMQDSNWDREQQPLPRALPETLGEIRRTIGRDQQEHIEGLQDELHHALLDGDPETITNAVLEMHRSDRHIRRNLESADPREFTLHNPLNQERVRELQESRLEAMGQRFRDNFLGNPQQTGPAMEAYLRTLSPQDALELARHIARQRS